MQQVDINKIINDLILFLTPKQRKIISGRFGLSSKFKTLQILGDELHITRERVRQIENTCIAKIKHQVKRNPSQDFIKFINFAKNHLLAVGGLREEKAFINDIILGLKINPKISFIFNKIKFILMMSGEFLYEEETNEMRAYWYLSLDDKKRFLDFVKDLKNFLENKDKKSIFKDKIYLNKCKNFLECHFLSIPKFFATNIFGDFGLADWPEINPKTIKEKAYLILYKAKRPMHFRELAKSIAQISPKHKKPTIQTVHNELIKDDKFVLIGRGIYALREYGYEPGTVKDVLMQILKKHGPLYKEKIVELVKTKRIVKENTILLNLQNKNYFQKLADGRFTLKEI